MRLDRSHQDKAKLWCWLDAGLACTDAQPSVGFAARTSLCMCKTNSNPCRCHIVRLPQSLRIAASWPDRRQPLGHPIAVSSFKLSISALLRAPASPRCSRVSALKLQGARLVKQARFSSHENVALRSAATSLTRMPPYSMRMSWRSSSTPSALLTRWRDKPTRLANSCCVMRSRVSLAIFG